MNIFSNVQNTLIRISCPISSDVCSHLTNNNRYRKMPSWNMTSLSDICLKIRMKCCEETKAGGTQGRFFLVCVQCLASPCSHARFFLPRAQSEKGFVYLDATRRTHARIHAHANIDKLICIHI